MYCKNCGHDEPEIKINNRMYCSNCGLSLGKEKEEVEAPSVVKDTKKEDELLNVFSNIGTTLEKKEGGSYRSKDFSILEQPKITKHLSYESQKPVQKMIEEELKLGTVKKKEEPNETKEETVEPNYLNPQETEEKQSDEKTQEQIAKDIIAPTQNLENSILNDILSDVESDEPIKKEDHEEIRVFEEEKNTEDTKKNALEASIKKVDELSAAQKLVDILEEEGNRKTVEKKKKKLDGLGRAFSSLIDILNQPVESPKPTKKDHVTDNHIQEILDSLQKTKEIESPLARTEIEPGVVAIDEGQKEDVSQEPESTIEEEIPKKTEQETEPPPGLEETTKEKETDKVEKEELVETDLPKNDPNFIEALHKELEKENLQLSKENNAKVEKEEKHKPLAEEELEKISNEVHSFGDKVGHIDHWPEEKIEKIDHNQHVLTDFLKALTKPKREEKKTVKEKIEKKKDSSSLKKLLVVIFSLLVLTLITISLIVLTKNNPKNQISNNERNQTINAYYIPIGYEKMKEENVGENNKITIFKHLSDDSRFIELKEEKISEGDPIDLEKYVTENSKSFLVFEKDNIKYFLMDEEKIAWTGDENWYILKRVGDLNKEDLIKIAESKK